VVFKRIRPTMVGLVFSDVQNGWSGMFAVWTQVSGSVLDRTIKHQKQCDGGLLQPMNLIISFTVQFRPKVVEIKPNPVCLLTLVCTVHPTPPQ